MQIGELADRLRDRFPEVTVARGEATVTMDRGSLLAELQYLRSEEDLSFGWLSDLSATDWPDRDPRIWVVYHLFSREQGHRVRVSVGLSGDDLVVPSVVGLFPAADWFEREVYDFFGVVFEGHPDLRRIMMPDDWEGHPLRKDYSLGGVGTRYRGAFIPPVDERNL